MHPKIPNSMSESNDEITGSKASISGDLLAPWFSERNLAVVRESYEGADIDCPMEILVIAAVLRGLLESTEDHVTDLEADGMTLGAEAARQRVAGYDNSLKALRDAWS